MNNLCTIGVRKGSKGVPGKNVKLLNGKPLLYYTIQHAKSSGLFDHIVISTDSEEIQEIGRSHGAQSWFLRPNEFATDEAPKIPAIRHALLESEKYFRKQFDVLVDLDVTSPLREVEDIKRAYKQFIDDDADVLITACESKKNPYFNMVEKVNGHVELVKNLEQPIGRRQEAPKVFDMNASIYIWKRDVLLNSDTLFTKRTSLYIMPEERSIDIDSNLDWEFVEFIFSKRKC